jgi:hypothetical protein
MVEHPTGAGRAQDQPADPQGENEPPQTATNTQSTYDDFGNAVRGPPRG